MFVGIRMSCREREGCKEIKKNKMTQVPYFVLRHLMNSFGVYRLLHPFTDIRRRDKKKSTYFFGCVLWMSDFVTEDRGFAKRR